MRRRARAKCCVHARLTAVLPQGDLNLNICEAHAFNTVDRFSLDVFVVNGWSGQARVFLKKPLECVRELAGDLVGGLVFVNAVSARVRLCCAALQRLLLWLPDARPLAAACAGRPPGS